jgi:hypothetical protein
MVIDQMKKQMSDGNSNGHANGSNGHAKVQWTIRNPFDKRNVQWPFDFSIGHLAWVLDINQKIDTKWSHRIQMNARPKI